MTSYWVKSNSVGDGTQFSLVAGDSITVKKGVLVESTATGTDAGTERCPIVDLTGGDNTVNLHGTAEGFVGVALYGGDNTVNIATSGEATGPNACVELRLGDNTITNNGLITGSAYGLYCGDPPTYATELAGAGGNTFTNNGTVVTLREYAVRMVDGGNTIDNTGTLHSYRAAAILFASDSTDSTNTIDNTGSIHDGDNGVAIIGGDGPTDLINDGFIVGDVDFGAGNDTYTATGKIDGTINGGAGDDSIRGSHHADIIDGGAGADKLNGGGGRDTFVYSNPSESTSGSVDIIAKFNFALDTLDVDGTKITQFSYVDAYDKLQPHEAALIPDGHVADKWFLLIDANGVVGYQAGQDYLIALLDPLHMPAHT